MTFCMHILKSQQTIKQYFLVVFTSKYYNAVIQYHRQKSIVLDAGIIDDFTTQLMQSKSNKWQIMRRQKLNNNNSVGKLGPSIATAAHKVQLKHLETDELDSLLRDALDLNDYAYIKKIVAQYIDYEKLPTILNLLKVLSLYSHNGDKEAVVNIIKLCEKVQPDILKEYFNFNHYLAEAMWVKGNVDEAIILFKDIYRTNVYLRRVIRSMLQFLLLDVCSKRSEAVLINIIRFATQLVEEFSDFYPLACIWQACFLSEWFSDQSTALNLLLENDGLLNAVSGRMPFVIALSLKHHRTEVVLRLLELLLKLKEMTHCKRVLEALFSYRVHQGDMCGCSEILQWSIEQGLELPAIQNETLARLLISYASKPTTKAAPKKQSPPTPKLHYKF